MSMTWHNYEHDYEHDMAWLWGNAHGIRVLVTKRKRVFRNTREEIAGNEAIISNIGTWELLFLQQVFQVMYNLLQKSFDNTASIGIARETISRSQ